MESTISSIITYVIIAFSVLFAMSVAGVPLRSLAFFAGALGIGIGFGLQNIVNNFVSGLILLFERPIKVGDVLDIEGQWGTVEKMGLRSTVIRSASKTEIIIPNSDFVTRKVENLTFSDPDYRVSVKVSVAYGSDTTKVRDLLIAIAKAHPEVISDPIPEAYFMEFGADALLFEVFAWTHDVMARRKVMSDLLCEIDRRFREEGIEIPFPQRNLHLQSIAPEVALALKKI